MSKKAVHIIHQQKAEKEIFQNISIKQQNGS